MNPRLRALAAGLLGLAVLGLGACGDDSPDPSADPSTDTSATGDPSQTASADPTDPTNPTAGTSAGGVAPATGPELHVGVTSLHVPEGFKVQSQQFTDQDVSARSKDGSIMLFEIRSAADVDDKLRVQAFLDSQPDGARTKRLPDVTLGPDDQHALRFAWTFKGDAQRYEAVLFYRDGTSVSINFIIRPSLDRKDPQAVESVLASVTWL